MLFRSQEDALSTGKARGTPGSCHHSKNPPDVSVHSRGTCCPCTALTFKPRIDSHHVCTWDSPVGKPRGKPRGKDTRENHRYFDPRGGLRDTAATALEESGHPLRPSPPRVRHQVDARPTTSVAPRTGNAASSALLPARSSTPCARTIRSTASRARGGAFSSTVSV